MNLNLEGPLGSAFLMPRQVIAKRQAAFLEHLAGEARIAVSTEAKALLQAMLGVAMSAQVVEFVKEGFDVEAFLRDGLGEPSVSSQLAGWIDSGEACADILSDWSGVSPRSVPTMNPLAAFPESLQYLDHPTLQSLDFALTDLRRFLETARCIAGDRDSPSAASELLDSMADYATDYEMMVATKVPLDEPFMLKYSERRDLQFSWRNEAAQDLVLSDANSNHVVLEVTDPSIAIRRVQATKVGSLEPTFGAFSSRDTRQAWSLYASDNDRDYKATLRFSIVPAWRLAAVPTVVAALLLLLTAALWQAQPKTLPELAVVAGPAALAASVLLTRDQSTLGGYLRRWTDVLVAGSLGVLLLMCVLLYWMAH